jgi:hypothetical protein
MTVQNEVEWLIDVIKANYPTTWPDDLVRRNRDSSTTYDKPNSPVHEEGVEATLYNTVSVSTGAVNRDLYGQGPQYRVETELDVRVEGLDEYESGQLSGDGEFKTLVRQIQYAIGRETVYPDVQPDANPINYITYLDASIVNGQSLSAESKDYYRRDFTVRLRGNAQTYSGTADTEFSMAFDAPFVG